MVKLISLLDLDLLAMNILIESEVYLSFDGYSLNSNSNPGFGHTLNDSTTNSSISTGRGGNNHQQPPGPGDNGGGSSNLPTHAADHQFKTDKLADFFQDKIGPGQRTGVVGIKMQGGHSERVGLQNVEMSQLALDVREHHEYIWRSRTGKLCALSAKPITSEFVDGIRATKCDCPPSTKSVS